MRAMLALPPSRHVPCERCGASVERRALREHVCDEERRLDYAVFQLRERVAAFDVDLAAWLDSPRGRFEQFYAERSRRRP